MKKSKRISAFIVAVLMAVTMFTMATPVYAKEAQTKIYAGAFYATGYLKSPDKCNASASTSASLTFDYIYTHILGHEVDSNGNFVRNRGVPISKENSKNSGTVSIQTLNSKNRFDNLLSSHMIKKGANENLEQCTLHW